MTVSPVTSEGTTISGTTIKATTVSPTPYCGGFISVPSDGVETVISPNYPEDYDDNLLCEWTVSASPGKRIRVHVEDFKTEKRHDYLDLGDGHDMDKEASRFETLTGNEKEQSHVTATDKMWMRFVTDHRKTYRGFKINLSEENECVNQSVVIPTGGSTIITSPNYPENYEDSVFCEWIVSTESLGNIRVYVDHFKTERNYDWVDMGTDSNSMNLSTRILHESGNKKTPHEFYTPSSIVWLTFMSDHDKTDDGFHMQLFDDACVAEHLTSESGVILSPNYPDDYPHNLDCVWVIQLPAGERIHLIFVDFYVEKNYDKLLIGEGLDPNSDEYVEFTHRHDGEHYFSPSNEMWLRFQTDWDKSKRGFDITYNSFNCPEGYTVGYNYGCYKFVEDPEDWDEARQDCESTEDGDLVIIDNEDELEFVRDAMDISDFWVGYYDVAEEGNWVWIDCSESTVWHLDNWAVLQPSGRAYEDCVVVNSFGRWNDVDCRHNQPYVCEITPKPFEEEDKNVQSVDGEAMSSSEILVTWTISEYNCDVLGYYVKYHRLDWVGGAVVVDVPGGAMTETMLTRLDSSTWYALYVAAYTHKGALEYVEGDPVQTHEVVKPPEPVPDEPSKHCGSNYTVKNDSVIRITSPNYPAHYGDNEYCEWYLDTSEGNTFLVHLRDMKTEYLYDWVDIGHGSDNGVSDSRVHHMSGVFRPWLYWQSESNEIWVKFTSDSTFTRRGFMLDVEVTFQEVPTEKPIPTEPALPETGCRENITIPSGGYVTVYSPNYPADYENDMDCLWLVDTQSGLRINVTFIAFETEYCHDWLEIGNSHNYHDLTTSVLRISGSQDQDALQSSDDDIWITFTSDYSITASGFHLVLSEIYETDPACGDELFISEDGQELIQSPNYPEHYNNNDFCKWKARTESPAQEILIVIDAFETETNYDWLEIGYTGTEGETVMLLYRFSGSEVSGSYTTPGQDALLLWRSDQSVTDRGFSVRLLSVDPCGATIVAPSGHVTSPFYPRLYPHNSDCIWTIEVSSSMIIQMTFVEFELEENYDYLYIGEGDVPGVHTVAELTGDEIPKDIIINNHLAWLRFNSDLSGDGAGFRLEYEEIMEDPLIAKPCGGSYYVKYASILYIQSPNYPSDYYNNEHCSWNFTADDGMLIFANFRDFATELAFDWVNMGNGLNTDDLSTMILRHSGQRIPSPQLSSGPHLWLTFITDNTVVHRGFLLQLEAVNDTESSPPKPTEPVITTPEPLPECGGHIQLPAAGYVNVTSPYYSDNYPHNELCEWTVNTTTYGRRIRVIYIDFYTERRFDYLELGDGLDLTDRFSRTDKHSGRRLPSPFTTHTSEMWMRFVTDQSVAYRGFHIQLREEIDCEETMYYPIPAGGSVSIRSPYYPDIYDHNMFCEWRVTAETGRNIRVVIQEFQTERNYDWVDIGTGLNSIDLSTRLMHMSGERQIEYYTISSDDAWMTFSSDCSRNDYQGFVIEYLDDGCSSETLTDESGTILSPMYDSPYPHNSDCIWIIDVSDDDDDFSAQITMVFNDFNLEYRYDNLLIGVGDDPDSDPDWVLTGYETPETLEIRSAKVWLRFQSDMSISRRGFNLTYTMECPSGYEFGPGEHCYKFVPRNSSWDEGRDDCHDTIDSDLVVIETDEELAYIRQKMMYNSFWIGKNI
ncbi:cubilin-like [Saccoglossus kowalevskii]